LGAGANGGASAEDVRIEEREIDVWVRDTGKRYDALFKVHVVSSPIDWLACKVFHMG